MEGWLLTDSGSNKLEFQEGTSGEDVGTVGG